MDNHVAGSQFRSSVTARSAEAEALVPSQGVEAELGVLTLTGLGGAVLTVVAGIWLVSTGTSAPTSWVFSLPRPWGAHSLGNVLTYLVFYGGMLLLTRSWLRLGDLLRRHPGVPARALSLIVTLWSVPFLLGPPLFSRDIYSYAADGRLTALGLNPYAVGPSALGAGRFLAAVSPIWRHTTSPYGPLFTALSAGVGGVAGGHLRVAVIGLRLVELLGVWMIARFLPRIARQLGADASQALWLGLASPVVLMSYVAAGHNDALMVGLLVAGLAVALEGRPALGIVLCTLAAAVKVPAEAGAVFIAVDWAWQRTTLSARATVIIQGALLSIGVFVALSLVTGYGWGWVTALGTPATVRSVLSPSTALGMLLGLFAHLLHLGIPTADFLTVTRLIGGLGAAVFGFVLLTRTRTLGMVRALGLTLLAVVVLGPIFQPWYLTWALVLLAAVPETQRWRPLIFAAAASSFVVRPNGSSIFSGPWLVAVIVAGSTVVFVMLRRRHRQRAITLITLPSDDAQVGLSTLREPVADAASVQRPRPVRPQEREGS